MKIRGNHELLAKAFLLCLSVFVFSYLVGVLAHFLVTLLLGFLPNEYESMEWLFRNVTMLITFLLVLERFCEEVAKFKILIFMCAFGFGFLFKFIPLFFIESSFFTEEVKINLSSIVEYKTTVLILRSAVLAPLIEEYIFRRFLYSNLRKLVEVNKAILFCSIFFSFIHKGELLSLISIFFASVMLCFLYEKTKVWWYPVALHSGANLGTIISRLF